MTDVIAEYQRWKQQGDDLRNKARQAMEARFRELLTEAAHIAEDYRHDFGVPLKPPPAVTAFRYKSGAKKPKKAAAKAAPSKAAAKAVATVDVPATPPAKPNPKIAALEKKLEAAKKKFEAAKAANAPTKNLEDRMYEIEDELRLARG